MCLLQCLALWLEVIQRPELPWVDQSHLAKLNVVAPPSANIRPAKPIINSIPINPVTLEEDFRLKAEACMAFSSELSDTITLEAISSFQVQITHAVKHIDHICYCCSWFVNPIELNLILNNEPILMATFETNILYRCDMDICNCSANFNFCHNCWNQISGGSKPKFGISNTMP